MSEAKNMDFLFDCQPADDFLAPRVCFLPPIPDLEIAADLLAAAADALLVGDLDLARLKLRQANDPVLYQYASRIIGQADPQVHRYRSVARATAAITKATKRMPSAADQRAMYARDGWRCRFCGCRIVLDKARRAMRNQVPDAIPWSEAEGFHAAFYALSGSVDHVLPHSAGGGNDLDNIVTACWPCQFGRSAWLIEEVGLIDPRSRPPIVDSWDGLTRVLRAESKSGSTVGPRFGKITPEMLPVADKDSNPSVAVKPVTLSEAESFAALDASLPPPSARLTSFLDGCKDLDVSWSVNKVMIARMKVGSVCVEFFGIQPDGKVQIPWSAWQSKDVFRSFAETLAAAIPVAICYETPKTWTVSKPQKKRLDVVELLSATAAIRSGLEEMNAKLKGLSVASESPRIGSCVPVRAVGAMVKSPARATAENLG